jgi:hypothetical protein
MSDYPVEWERYYQQDLLVLWDLLGAELRARTTPEAFRAWVYEYSLHEGWSSELPVYPVAEMETEFSPAPYLQLPLVENYLRMYRYSESHYLPLLRHREGALESLGYLCWLSEE